MKLLVVGMCTVFSQKVFVLCGLNTSIIHYQQHKHPAKYNLLLSNSVDGQENMKQTLLSHFVMGRNMPVPSSKMILQTVLPSGGRLTSIVNDSGLQQVISVEFQNMNTRQNIDSIIDRIFQDKSPELKMNVKRILNKKSREDVWKFIRCAVE